MRARSLLATATVALALTAIHSNAFAEPMDPALERLVRNPGCQQIAGPSGPGNVGYWNPVGGAGSDGRCLSNDVAFKRLVNQYGYALAPTAMHTARTTGYGGFELSLEGSFTSLDSDAEYMKLGTQGSRDANTNKASVRNNSPDELAQVYYLKARKGFPFGLEMAAMLGTMSHTSFMIIGTDVRLALLEGFRQGAMGILPDVAVGGGVRTITGTAQLQLTTVGLDIQLSKPIPIADSAVLSPYIGYQHLWIFGDSGTIDTTPNTDPLGLCGYQGPDVPGTPGASGSDGYGGQPVCDGGTSLDFNNTMVFDAVRLQRQRLMAGLQYRYEMVTIAAQYIGELTDPAAANDDDEDLQGVPKQFTVSVQLGMMF